MIDKYARFCAVVSGVYYGARSPPRLAQLRVATTLEVMSGRSKAVILFHLMDGTKRFGELRRKPPGVTQRMMTLQLRELQRDGVVQRVVYAEVPPKVEYSLTDFGHSLIPALIAMRDWGRSPRATLVATREAQEAA